MRVCKAWNRLAGHERFWSRIARLDLPVLPADVALPTLFRRLQSLRVAKFPALTDAGLKALASHCKYLERLDLEFCSDIT